MPSIGWGSTEIDVLSILIRGDERPLLIPFTAKSTKILQPNWYLFISWTLFSHHIHHDTAMDLSRANRASDASSSSLVPAKRATASAVHNNRPPDVEASAKTENELSIPSCRTAPDCVLKWPTLQKYYEFDEGSTIDSGLFHNDFSDSRIGTFGGHSEDSEACESFKRAVPELLECFLQTTYLQYPILEIRELKGYAAEVFKFGCRLDVETCLIVSKIVGSMALYH
jgi:hypothetical protein